MSIKVHSGPLLSRYTDSQEMIEVDGETVGECLNNLAERFPKLELFDKNGKLLDYFGIYVNGENAYPNELDLPVKDGDELSIVLIIAGG